MHKTQLEAGACPKCGAECPTVATIYAEGTTATDGEVDGSVVGTSLYGGLGVGYGIADIHTVSQTMLAKRLAPPERATIDGSPLRTVVLAVILGALIIAAPSLASAHSKLLSIASLTVGILIVLRAVVAVPSVIRREAREQREAQISDSTRLDAWRSLRYCRNDTLVFDPDGRTATADERGISSLTDSNDKKEQTS